MGLGTKAYVFHRGAGGAHQGYAPFDQALGRPGVFHLLADGDLEAFFQKLAQVYFGRVVRHAAHGYGVFRLGVAAGQGDLQGFGGDHGIVVKQLVEIAHAVKEQGVLMFPLDGQILGEHGGDLALGNVRRRMRGRGEAWAVRHGVVGLAKSASRVFFA